MFSRLAQRCVPARSQSGVRERAFVPLATARRRPEVTPRWRTLIVLPTRGQAEGGFTASERYLARLCERSFLSLWSHPNVFRAPNKELCDLLVVFGDHVIVFSDKSCALKPGPHGWSRWFRSAISDSASQLHRAAGWVRAHRDQLFMDVRCTVRFPFELPSNPKVHLIAVAIGAAAACREDFGGGSGSLVITPASDGTEPFTVGDLDPDKPFVHVLDETSLDLVMRELDTVDDFVRYLVAKESFVRSGQLVSAAGEEDLLAYYLQRFDETTGDHAFVFDDNPTGVVIDEMWEAFTRTAEYRAKKEADKISYLWDGMIESVAKCAAEGRLVTGNEFPLQAHEQGLRLLAAERRVVRRGLAKSLRDVLLRSDTQDLFARTMPSGSHRDHGYVFLTIKRRADFRSEERYRTFRQRTLMHYCDTVKLRQPSTSVLVGLGFGAQSERDGSIDMLVREFDGWTEDDAARADDMRRKYGWSDGDDLPEVHSTEYEYPVTPQHPAAPAVDKRQSVDRDRRSKRKAQRAARKKNRR